STALVLFRRDLRLVDNPAWSAVCATHTQVLPVFIHAPDEDGGWSPGAASRTASAPRRHARCAARTDPAQRRQRGLLEPVVRTRRDRPRHAYQKRAARTGHRSAQLQRRAVVRALANRHATRRSVQGFHALLAQLANADPGKPAVARARSARLAELAGRFAVAGTRSAAAHRLGQRAGR